MEGSQPGPWHTTVPKTTLPGLPPSSPTCSLSLHCPTGCLSGTRPHPPGARAGVECFPLQDWYRTIPRQPAPTPSAATVV